MALATSSDVQVDSESSSGAHGISGKAPESEPWSPYALAGKQFPSDALVEPSSQGSSPAEQPLAP